MVIFIHAKMEHSATILHQEYNFLVSSYLHQVFFGVMFGVSCNYVHRVAVGF